MNKKEWLILAAFIVAPMGFFAAGIYYGPKLKTWYSDKKKKVEGGATPGDGDAMVNSDLVEIKNIDEANKKITLSINKNPDMFFSYRTGGVPMAQMIQVRGLESTNMALRYVDGVFMVTDGETILFKKVIETI